MRSTDLNVLCLRVHFMRSWMSAACWERILNRQPISPRSFCGMLTQSLPMVPDLAPTDLFASRTRHRWKIFTRRLTESNRSFHFQNAERLHDRDHWVG